jgi:YegS/Rv2252/BmrU family lipid kinase
MRIAAIVNPVSGWGTARKKWPELHASGSAAAGVETFWSEYPGHSVVLAASVRRSGFDRVIAVGGDGTLFEVLNGLWWERQGELPSVGMVPIGTGCDYIRNFEAGRSLAALFDAAVGPSTIKVSLGHCRIQHAAGVRDRVFAMVLGVGFDAEVVRYFRSGRFGRAGWHAYALSVLGAFRSLKSYVLSGKIDGTAFHANALCFGTALGCYFGKRMEIAPPASPVRNDFELVWVEPVAFPGLLFTILLSYFGAHYKLSWVKTARASRVFLDSFPPASIEADGELIGKTPVEIEIIPGAFSFAAEAVRRRNFSDRNIQPPGVFNGKLTDLRNIFSLQRKFLPFELFNR